MWRRMERTPNTIRRAARSAPTADLARVAEVAGTSKRAVVQALRSLKGRGRCAALLTAAPTGLGAAETAGVVGASRCPPSVARLAALHKSPRVKAAARGASGWIGRTHQHLAAPRSVLAAAAAAASEGDDIKELMAQGRCSRALLTRLADDKRFWMRECVALSISAPPWALATLARSEEPWTRHSVATNPHCASPHLWRLARDPNDEVRAAARAALWQRQ